MAERERKRWESDQIAKSEFFHRKLHEWGLLEIAYEIDAIRGEELEWDLQRLHISPKAWNKIIHRGIKPITVFCHPDVLVENPKRVSYYRMLAMVSRKSMARVGLAVDKYEDGKKEISIDDALKISNHLNKIISILVENDEKVDPREFDLWRGMAASSQAQGSWQNAKGSRVEFIIKDLLERRLREGGKVAESITHGKSVRWRLRDGREVVMGNEPDVGIYRDGKIEAAVEIKGGIDPAGVLERFGAALKSLRRVKQENPEAITVLIVQEVSLTPKAKEEIERSGAIVNYFFVVEDVIANKEIREKLFKILNI